MLQDDIYTCFSVYTSTMAIFLSYVNKSVLLKSLKRPSQHVFAVILLVGRVSLLCMTEYISVAEVWFGPVFILSGETGNRTAGSVQHIAQTGTRTTINSSDRFGSHLNRVQMWNRWPSGFWPHESSIRIYWCCVHALSWGGYIYYIILYWYGYIFILWGSSWEIFE